MAVYTFHCVDQAGLATTFELHDLTSDVEAVSEASRLFGWWDDCDVMEVAREDGAVALIGRPVTPSDPIGRLDWRFASDRTTPGNERAADRQHVSPRALASSKQPRGSPI